MTRLPLNAAPTLPPAAARPNILAAVGDRLPQAAANARMSVERFQAVAASDKDFRFE
jgi:hypothetical protein